MERYTMLTYDCVCDKCDDVFFIVFDLDLECEIAELRSEQEALEFIALRKSQDVLHGV